MGRTCAGADAVVTAPAEEGALIWCPFPDEAAARAAISNLLDARLIACGNILPGVQSFFAWQGERGDATECGALLKTTAARLDEAMAALRAQHPYDAPAIAGWTVRIDEGTLRWLTGEVATP